MIHPQATDFIKLQPAKKNRRQAAVRKLRKQYVWRSVLIAKLPIVSDKEFHVTGMIHFCLAGKPSCYRKRPR